MRRRVLFLLKKLCIMPIIINVFILWVLFISFLLGEGKMTECNDDFSLISRKLFFVAAQKSSVWSDAQGEVAPERRRICPSLPAQCVFSCFPWRCRVMRSKSK